MPRIPYNPSRIVAPAQQQPSVQVPVAAAGAANMQNAQLANVGQRLIGATADMQRQKRETETRADFAAFRTQLAELQAQAKIDLDSIPVEDGVDFEEKAASIRRKYLGKASDWINASGNVRHRGAKELFEQELKQAESQGRIDIMNRAAQYERQRSIARHEREIELGIRIGDEGLIRNSVAGLVENGKLTSAQAESYKERQINAMHKFQDDQRLTEADNALHAGDFEAFDAAIASLALPTEAERRDIRNRKLGTHAYHSAQGNLRQIEDLTGLQSFIEDPEEFAAVKGMSANHRQQLLNEAHAKVRQIERQQVANARRFMREAAAGRLDWSEFEAAKEMDTRDGISSIPANEIRQAMRSAELDRQDADRFQIDRHNPAYKALLDELTEEGINGRRVTKRRKETYADFRERIQGLPIGDTARANLWDRYLLMREADLRDGREDFSRAFIQPFGIGDTRRIGEVEQRVRINVATEMRQIINDYGPMDNIGTMVEEIDSELRSFFLRNPNPTQQQIDAKMDEIDQRMIEATFRRSLRLGNRIVRQGGQLFELPTE